MQSQAGMAVLTVFLRNRKSNSSFLHCFSLQHSPWLIKITALIMTLQLWPCSAEKDPTCLAPPSSFQERYPFLGAKKGLFWSLGIPGNPSVPAQHQHFDPGQGMPTEALQMLLTQAKVCILKHCRCFWYPRKGLILVCLCIRCATSLMEKSNVAPTTTEGFREGYGSADLSQA